MALTFRSLFKDSKNDLHFYSDRVRNILPLVLLEIAHALSRGRKPTSSSFLPGENLREWLYMVYCDEEISGQKDDLFGEPCTYITDLEEGLEWLPTTNKFAQKLLSAIRVCRKLLKPKRLPKDMRGDRDYQASHHETNLKRKQHFWDKRTGVHQSLGYHNMDDYILDCERRYKEDTYWQDGPTNHVTDIETITLGVPTSKVCPPVRPAVRRIRKISALPNA